MKCPKCGYISFDYLDRCKSCGDDLVPTKIKLNIYTKQPEIEMDEDGFAVEKVNEDHKDLLGGKTTRADGSVSMDDVIKEDGEIIETFDFGEDEKA
ncbi:MAG TPA: hypothetical protein ENN34_01485 [Deltaproteobacteria bacterium]|nr:hypothetical protein [Deltaproteobacteria bacterium]